MERNYANDPRAMLMSERAARKGTVLKAVGWLLIVFDLIPVVWLWVGWRSGSDFWMWWVLAEGVIGVALLIAGTIVKSRSAREFAEYDRGESGPKAA